MTTTIDGTRIARDIRARVAQRVAEAAARGRVPGLATVLVGDDPASAVYVAAKRRAIREAGMHDVHRHLSPHARQEEVAAVIDELAADPDVSGILLLIAYLGRVDRDEWESKARPLMNVILDGLRRHVAEE
ncbi:tetrahydrofolate dehydrogenase/cyclohydrolase catalytic domain-containing protein [Streptomyces sp. NPDC010273]|uniref:tetrahydrofolate dehydrogenase/cyclohydrolase catalytic domain-containing protein n=1 Tax=Streptomyces sp. NPDC010273 TaxID=3364829 RepID=UPI0036EFB879